MSDAGRAAIRESRAVPDGAPRPRVLFYSHDGYGLGHIRITLAIAGALAARRPDAALLILTGSFETHGYELPANVDYVKLPSVSRRDLYAGLPIEEAAPGGLRQIWHVREALIQETANVYAPDLVVVDHAPAGLNSELLHTLACLRGAEPRPVLALCLRDVTYGPATTKATWHREGAYELMESTYDRIMIYGSRDIFDPVREYEFPPGAAAKTQFCGYIHRSDPIQPPEQIRQLLGFHDAPLVVVVAGGGADGRLLIDTYIDVLRAGHLPGVGSFIVSGPMVEAHDLAALEAAIDGLPGVKLVAFTADLMSYLNAANAIVTMGGYNAVCEAVSLGKRAIVIPRVAGSDEQLIRAERFARRGLITMLRTEELTAIRLGGAVREALQERHLLVTPPDFGGLPRIADALADILPR